MGYDIKKVGRVVAVVVAVVIEVLLERDDRPPLTGRTTYRIHLIN